MTNSFDLNPDTTGSIFGGWNGWAHEVAKNYLEVCQNKTVLEIACSIGKISEQIVKQRPKPKSLIMVEPGNYESPLPESDTIKFVKDDIHHWLLTAPKMQVVLCFGLLYHLHSPLYLLELIVNNCDPETLIMDSTNVNPQNLSYKHEEMNIPGNRHIRPDWKYCPFNLPVPFSVINQSLDHMGYELDKSHYLKCDVEAKSKGWVASWNKKVNQI